MMVVAKELFFFFGATTRAHIVVSPLETMSQVLAMAREGMDSFAHVVGWSALVVAARPALEKGCFSWVRVNEVAEATIKSPTRQIDTNLTSTFQKATVERVLGGLANVIGLCGEEEAIVVVLSSVTMSVEAELVMVLCCCGRRLGKLSVEKILALGWRWYVCEQ